MSQTLCGFLPKISLGVIALRLRGEVVVSVVSLVSDDGNRAR